MLTFQNMFAVIIVLAIAGFVVGIVFGARRRINKEISKAKEEEIPEPSSVCAQVLDMAVAGEHGGGKVSHYTMHFYVKFLIGATEEVIYDVPEELYESLNIGDRGTLITVGKQFIDFAPETDVEEN
ncbi:MAG: DUF2500 family protein [Clostridia bacterium]|nr:DUF2500 family protein [Clostridia bacterium]